LFSATIIRQDGIRTVEARIIEREGVSSPFLRFVNIALSAIIYYPFMEVFISIFVETITMEEIAIRRMPTSVLKNDIPIRMDGIPFELHYAYNFACAPPIKDNTYFVKVLLRCEVVHATTKKVLHVLDAEFGFAFKATMPEAEAITNIYRCYLTSVRDFDIVMKETKSYILTYKRFDDVQEAEIREAIINSLRFNSVN
jgi:hypothetical protein